MARLKSALAGSAIALVLACAGTAYAPLGGRAEPLMRLAGPDAPAAGTARAGAGVQIAQGFGMPPANVGNGDGADAGGDASLVVRIGQLEEQVRQLNGKIEQLQFANRQLEDQMRKFQQDVEFRFQEQSRKGGRPLSKRSDASGVESPTVADSSPAPAVPPAAAPRQGSRDDAFDPTKNPNAPGAPRALGSGGANTPSGDVASNDDAPINLLSSPQQSPPPDSAPPPASTASPSTGSAPPAHPSSAPATAGLTTPGGTVIADTHADPVKEDFDVALGYLKQKDYENAERSFAAFVAKNPKNRRTSDALYYLGETYYLRGRQREAAEQYLKISANYATSPRAPEAMLRLGEALHALGDKEQACAAFGEVPRRYPKASAAIKASAEREAKKAQC